MKSASRRMSMMLLLFVTGYAFFSGIHFSLWMHWGMSLLIKDNENKDKSTNHEVGSKKPLETEPTAQHQRPIKFYAIHIGPSKTGTSAIQKDFAQNPFGINTLGEDKDNIIYVGKREGRNFKDPNANTEIRNVSGQSMTGRGEKSHHHRAMKCMIKKLEEYYESSSSDDRDVINKSLETDEEARAFLRQQFIDECYIGHKYMLNYSIVDSNESYSSASVYQTIKSQFRIFDILGYERLIVVGAYRRYADWIVSAYNEKMKGRCLYPNLNGEHMRVPCPGIGDWLSKHLSRKIYRARFNVAVGKTLPTIIEAGPSKLETKILNFFQLPHSNNESDVNVFDSITTELYCDAFGKELTPHTCNHAQNIARGAHKTHRFLGNTTSATAAGLVVNKGSTSYSVYQQITAAGHRLGFILPTDKQLQVVRKCAKSKQQKGSFALFRCDADTKCYEDTPKGRMKCSENKMALREELRKFTSGDKASIIGTNSTSIRTYKDLSDYHTKVHGLSWTESLPIQCLKKDKLDRLLQKSLEFEQSVMPEFYATPLGKDEHIRLFWDVWLEEKKLFCWVDINRLFKNATSWDEIINERMVSYDWDTTHKTRGL